MGYSVAYPSSSIRRPSFARSLALEAGVGCKNRRDPARSPWIIWTTMSPRPAAITPRSPHALVVPEPSDCVVEREGRGPRFPRASASHLAREALLAVHCTFEPAASPLPPPHPDSPRRTGHRLPNFNDQSSGRTSTSWLTRLPGVRREEGAGGGSRLLLIGLIRTGGGIRYVLRSVTIMRSTDSSVKQVQ
jgi:hypothetical protein